MFKLSVVEAPKERMLVVQGSLIATGTDEFKVMCNAARAGLSGREFVVEIKDVTSISQAGENMLLELLASGVKLRGCGMFPKLVLQQLAHRARSQRAGGNR